MKPRLLVVDDDPDTRELLDHALSRAGFEVRLARAGLETVDCARQFRPELIVLDLMLPDVDGYTVAELLRPTRKPGRFRCSLSAQPSAR